MKPITDSTLETWFVIINPTSGGGKGKRRWPKIKKLLSESLLQYNFSFSNHKGHIEEIAKSKIKDGFRKFIIVGGDGSLNGFINGVCNQEAVKTDKIKLAMISLGTGNDWVRSERIPSTAANVIEAIKLGETQAHDIGCIIHDESKSYFINMMGLGFDAFVLNNYYNIGGPYIGKIKYIYALALSLFRYKTQEIRFEIDKKEVFRGLFYNLSIGIGRYAGGGMKMTPKSNNSDQKFDATLIAQVPKWKVILNVPRLFTGAFTTIQEASEYRSSTVTIYGDQLLVQADGEELGRTNHIEISNSPNTINVVVC